MKQYSKGFAVLLFAVLLATPTLAGADKVYRWTDENGVQHFGDMPPAHADVEVLEVEGIPKIGSDSLAHAQDAQDPATVEPTAAAKRRQEIADNRKERRAAGIEMQRICDQAQQQLENIEPHRRVYYTDEIGETVRMDDEERVGTVARLKKFLDSNCG